MAARGGLARPYSGNFCVVPGCANSSGKDKASHIKRSYFSFPKDNKRKKLWINAIPRANWMPSRHSRICSDHFVEGKKIDLPGSPGYIPTIFTAASEARGKRKPQRRETRTSRRCQALELPVSTNSRKKRKKDVDEVTPGRPKPKPKPAEANTDDQKSVWSTTDHDYVKTKVIYGCQTKEQYLTDKLQYLEERNSDLRQRVVSIDSLTNQEFSQWTNMPNREVFDAVAIYLRKRGGDTLKYWRGKETTAHTHFVKSGMAKPGPCRKLTFEEELFLVLVKLKTGLNNRELQHLFGISETIVSQIFTTLVNFLHVQLKVLFEMGSDVENWDAVAECYKDFPNLKVVLDCTELFTQRSSNLQARKEFYSNYKGHETVKYMVGLSPALTVNFVSEGYGGRASDKHITLQSKQLFNSLIPGSSVMTDRGFNIGEELKKKGVELIIPDFKGRGRSQMTKKELENSENIARARIHIERIIQRIRTFQILGKTLNLCSKDIFDQIFTVCAYLTNFQLPIIR